MSTLTNLSQFENAHDSIISTPSGILISNNSLQFENTLIFKVFILLDNFTLLKFSQSQNAK